MKAAGMLLALGSLSAAAGQPPLPPSPPFAVGNVTTFIRDLSRGVDPAVGVTTGVRTLITEIWYPAAPGDIPADAPRATYGDYVFGDRAVHRLMMTETTFFHLTPDTVVEGVSEGAMEAAIDELFTRPRRSFVNIPVARQGAPHPIVLMTHGDAGSRYNMETVCEHLAAYGYVVVAPEHTGNSPYSMIGRDPAFSFPGKGPPLAGLQSADLQSAGPELLRRLRETRGLLDERGLYGASAPYGQTYAPSAVGRDANFLPALDSALLQRVEDLRATLNALAHMNQGGFLDGALDMDRIGLMGRSFGGATTLAAMLLEDRFLAGMAVAAPSLPDNRHRLAPEMLAPAGAESVVLSQDGPYGLGEINKPMLLLSGAEDRLIINLAAVSATAAGTAAPTPDNPHPVLRAAYLNTDAPVVWALLADANHASFGVSGAYWWPQLKPSRFPRHFQPDVAYSLVDSHLAHRIQQDKALAFFDLMVRRDQAARKRLLDPGYAAVGLTLEHRNF